MNTDETLAVLLQKIEGLETHLMEKPSPTPQQSENRLLLFTEKEIIQMPKTFRKTFRIQGCTAHVRKRTDGRYNCSYEIRYAKKPYDKHPISASGTTLEQAKAKFIEKLNNYIPQDDITPTIPTDFDGFAMYWFENFHKRKVADKTFDHNIKLYNRHIKEVFGKLLIAKINAALLQSFLDKFASKGKTSDDLHCIINQILNSAVKHGIIQLNPLGMCFHEIHEREHGRALTKDEERLLIATYTGTKYLVPIVIALYTGLRPNEYPTATIDGNFIKAVNSKRKGKKLVYKRIPISPMLRPYINENTVIQMPKPDTFASRLKAVIPDIKPYDLRTTFQTRCDQCGIPDKVIGIFMGNTIGKGDKLKEAYTDLEDPEYLQYLFNEGQKLNY